MSLDLQNGLITLLLAVLGGVLAIHAPGKKERRARWVYGSGFLVLLIWGGWVAFQQSAEAKAKSKSAESKAAEDTKRSADMQAKLDSARTSAADCVAQVTGGDGFPLAVVRVPPLRSDSLNILVLAHGEATIYDVSYSVHEGPLLTPEQLTKLPPAKVSAALAWRSREFHIGDIHANRFVTIPYRIHPSKSALNTYVFGFDAKNGSVMETLDVRFNPSIDSWQYRTETRDVRGYDQNAVLLSVDWLPNYALFKTEPATNPQKQ